MQLGGTVLYYITYYNDDGVEFQFNVANVAQATQTVISYNEPTTTWTATPN